MQNTEQEPALKAPRVEFGVYLRKYRKIAGMRQKALAAVLGWSVSKISMVERGERPADEDFARAADAALRADGELLGRWRETVEHATHWPVWLAQLTEIEQQADTLRLWQPLIVPGMLQTPEYARAVFRGKPATTPEVVEQNLQARLERQRVLQRDNGPTIWAILDEVVLIRPVGSEAVMAEQMEHLATLDELPHINVRVLPRTSWLTTGLQGAFVLASGTGMPETAYIESITLSQITADSGRRPRDQIKIRNVAQRGPTPAGLAPADKGDSRAVDDATAKLLKIAKWRKATRSGEAGDCIEVAPLADGRVGLRDSEHPEQPAYVVSPSVWAAFIDGVKKNEFDF